LVGVKTWAVAHLISNGDLGSIVLFGSFLVWAVYDRITLKRRTDPGAPAIPVGGHRNDVIALVVGTLLYLALGLVFHPLVVGIPVFGRPAY
ncbi:MAG: NnrU family protein, partial [Xanthobacteraceae bacterium]